MTITDKAIRYYGADNPITIAITVLEEQGKTDLAQQLFLECLALGCDEDAEECLDWDADECGFDPYEGCYTYDC